MTTKFESGRLRVETDVGVEVFNTKLLPDVTHTFH